MNLALPLGLIGLSAILALILIYIFKPKYQDKKVSSTYVWKLSLQYRKRKVPLQWLQSSLLFLIQILILALIAFTMSEPFIVLASKDGEKIVVLDASASMLAEENGESRFERAKGEIASLAAGTVPTDKFSVILASDEATFLIRRSDSETYIRQKLFEAECGFGTPMIEDAMELAEGVLEENPSADVYLYTDKDYSDSGSVKVVNLTRGEWNAAILDFKSEFVKGEYIFTAEVASYVKAAEIPISIKIDGKEHLSRLAVCDENGKCGVTWDNLDIFEYTRAEVSLVADDQYNYDNRFVIFNSDRAAFHVQFVSADSGFLYWALSSVPSCSVTLVNDIAEAKKSGFDLYVYNHVMPAEAPEDGTIWLIDPTPEYASMYGFTLGTEIEGEFTLTGSGGASEACRTLSRGITPTKIALTKFTSVTSYTAYESILTCNNMPVLLSKNESGKKTLVLAFNIHWSNLALLPDFPLLINNMCAYSLSPTVDKTEYYVGEEVEIHTRPNMSFVTVTEQYAGGGEGETSFQSLPITLKPTRAGVYTVIQTLTDGKTVTDSFTVLIPEAESVFYAEEDTLPVPVVIGTGTDTSVAHDTVDIYVYLAAGILVLLCIEWGLQYREQ